MPLAAAVAVIVVVPGPNVVAVTMSAMRDRRAGLWTALGVSAGGLLWATAALVGLGTLLEHSRPLSMGLKWLGAAYLAIMAVGLWRAGNAEPDQDGAGAGSETATGRRLPTQRRRPFVSGLLVDLANPKAAVFFTSLYASLLPAHLDLWSASAILTVTVTIILGWYCLLALLLSQAPAQRLYRRARRALARVSAGAMGLLGIRLALSD